MALRFVDPVRAVDQRDPVEQEGGGERPEHEVLHAGFLGLVPAHVHGGEDVDGERQDLEADEQHDQVVGRRHDHAARGRQQDERVQLGALDAAPAAGSRRRTARSSTTEAHSTIVTNTEKPSTP